MTRRAPDVAVIAAVDLSAISLAVVQAGVRVAGRLGGECLVLHVVEALSGGEDAGPLLPTLRRWVAEVRREAREGLERLLADSSVAGQGPRGEVAEGKAFERIAHLARERAARLVVVGGPPPHRLLGSTAERVIRKSPAPVLVVRRPPPDGYRSVLVGVDFSAGAERALGEALALVEPGAAVTACHVLDTLGLPRTDEVLSATADLLERLQAWVAERSGGARVEARVEIGRPREVLLEAAQGAGADLLAVGSRGRGRISHLLLGSVAEAAARRAPCDVLVAGSGGAPPKEGPG